MPGYAQAMIKHCSHKPSIYAGVTDQASRCWRCCARSHAIYAHLLPGGGLQAWGFYLQKPVHLFPFSMKIYACWQFYWPFAQLASADNPPMLQLMGLNLPTPLHVYKPYPHTSGSMQRPSKNPSEPRAPLLNPTADEERPFSATPPKEGRPSSCPAPLTHYTGVCVLYLFGTAFSDLRAVLNMLCHILYITIFRRIRCGWGAACTEQMVQKLQRKITCSNILLIKQIPKYSKDRYELLLRTTEKSVRS